MMTVKAGMLHPSSMSKRQRQELVNRELQVSDKTKDYIRWNKSNRIRNLSRTAVAMIEGKIPFEIQQLQQLADDCENERKIRL